MPRHSIDADQYSEQEIIARRDATIKRMLATPPQPHSEMKIGKPRSKRTGSAKRQSAARKSTKA
jgi:hypothetical protein